MQDGLGNLEVLIVDDSPQMRTIIGTVLAAVGIRKLRYATHGMHALETLAQHPIDVAYVDYEMPVMDGLRFVSAVRRLPTELRYMPIIMLTGHCDLARIHIARDQGVTEFIRKPVTSLDILKRLEAVILQPRRFIDSDRYIGPDRRRHVERAPTCPRRRASDVAVMQL